MAAALPPAAWGPSFSSYDGKIRGGAITAGCGDSWRWATGAGTLPEQGKYRIQYRIDRIDSDGRYDILVGVASRAARVEDQDSFPKGCYCWLSYFSGDDSSLRADGSLVQVGIPRESRAGSTIEIIVDQDASTVEFRLDGAPVKKGGTACKLTVKPEHKQDLTPAASVLKAGSALTLVAVEAVAR